MIRRLLLLPLAAMLAWVAGFLWFLHVAGQTAEPPPPADGIVALTGGADRIEAALHLLAQGAAPRLLISGVGGAADFRALGIDPALASRVTIGRAAATTHGNALETANWVHANAVRSLIVVTAGYHMPRARAELARALPDTTLISFPVQPASLRMSNVSALKLLASEYTKYLTVAFGLSDRFFSPAPERTAE
jgi:uncharacterized SAM-binding protein YcdF (DUF218 family)